MAAAVRTAMRELAAKRDVGPRTGDMTRARADDDLGPSEGADSLHVLDRDMPNRALAMPQRRRDRRKPAHAQPAHTRRGRNAKVAGRQRPPEHLGGDDDWQQSRPDPGEILVRVQACGLNHVDHALSSGTTSQPSGPAAHNICPMDAAGTVIAAGDRVTRFAVGDEVFGHFLTDSWAWIQTLGVRTTADGPHVERRPEGLDPLAAAALAEGGLTAKTIMRAAALQPGQTAVVIGATARAGTVLVPLLAEAGGHVIAAVTPGDEDYVRSLGAADTIECATADPLADALASHPDADLLVDLVSFGEPYFITAAAGHGTSVTALAGPDEPGIPRIRISAEPGDLAALAQRALDGHQPAEIAPVGGSRRSARHRRPTTCPAAEPAVALGG
ncbi:MAG: NADP-dependent oxidoreductase [Solirubrobacterales bacterium]|nr:NADP-dependent oxidoreductase [Solirubrobacterales bacterium]